ncbi:XdhC family protein [Bacillus sp. NTK034]|uniref:XdhC family protein n=1 Tax=Bacillus sp. NTK034 TaxID=2802176 RepID=UPI001A8C976C|nr:XdhC/CoxI family protein [Bacillus sp. NTK034]MBN8203142.1 XdhC family protein [Bacillus sp. NTK034]
MIINELKRCIRNNEKAILATIIDKKGSSYRQVGAKSLIFSDGSAYGVLSGGCIEQDLLEHARDVFETGEPKQIIYDLRNDHNVPWGLGVGCNGVITVLLSLIDPVNNRKSAVKQFKVLKQQSLSKEPYPVCTVIKSSNHNALLPGTILENIELPLFKIMSSGILENYSIEVDGKKETVTIFLETITPMPHIIIFGAGPDASSLIDQLKFLHWRVTIVDHRPGYLNKDNFPYADELNLVPQGEFPEDLNASENSYAIIMTHHYEQDLVYLKGLLQQNLSYIGLLGPKRRFNNLKKDLQAQGFMIPAKAAEKIYSPIGLDIGSETPEEIALSIAAEIMAHKNKTSSQSLKWKKDSIHTPNPASYERLKELVQ